MPQMSPLGWIWVVMFVVMGYCLVLMFCYSMLIMEVFFKIKVIEVPCCSWMW